MTIVSLSSPSPSTTTSTVAAQTTLTATTANSVTQSAIPNGGDTTSISGHAMLLLRLFHTDDPEAQPPVMTIMTTQDLSGNSASFLKMGDRKLLERAYEYASANDIDPLQVDGMAFHLAFYRHMQASGDTNEITYLHDSEGNAWVGKFNAHEAELAKRMLTSQAINKTDMDTDFLAYMLNPQRGGGSQRHSVSFESLEKFISALSPSGGKPSADGEASQPVQPTNPALAQALYRIDHPYVGAKWAPIKPQDSDQPLKHLSKNAQNQLMRAYQFALMYGSTVNLEFLDHMSALTGITQMEKDGSLKGGSSTPQATIERLGKLFHAINNPDAHHGNQSVLPIKAHHIDTSV